MKVKPDKEVYMTEYAAIRIVFTPCRGCTPVPTRPDARRSIDRLTPRHRPRTSGFDTILFPQVGMQPPAEGHPEVVRPSLAIGVLYGPCYPRTGPPPHNPSY